MKRLLITLIVFLIGIGIGIYYYTNLDNNYHAVQEFYDFPIPSEAKLESETQNAKHFKWEPATGTEVPLSYRLMIKKSGWKQVDIDGANIIYKKDGKSITLGFATDYIGIFKNSK